MENDVNALHNYDKEDVMKYLSVVMNKLADIENDNNLKNKQLYNYEMEVKRLQDENLNLKNQINYYKQLEANLNDSVSMVKETRNQIKNNALKEREVILLDAKSMASRIVNEALIKSEKIELEASNLQKSVSVYKNKLKTIIDCQLQLIEDVEKIDF